MWQQNRHQKVFYRGLCICAAEFDILKFEQTCLHVSIWGGLELCFRGAKATEAPLWRQYCVAKLQLAF